MLETISKFFSNDLYGTGISSGALVVGIILSCIIVACVIYRSYLKDVVIRINDKQIIQTVKNNSSDKDNFFLNHQLTLKVAKRFIEHFLSRTAFVYKRCRNNKKDQYIRMVGKIEVKLLEVNLYASRIFDNDFNDIKRADHVCHPNDSIKCLYSGYKLQPLTEENDREQFASAISEYVKAIMNTKEAKKYLHINEFEIKFVPYDSDCSVIVLFSAPNRYYKEPPVLEKWK